jgi:hypothetical protein
MRPCLFLTGAGQSRAMTTGGVAETRIYSGEVWTDARGQAIVVLPDHVDASQSSLTYELTSDRPSSARVASELRDHRFTIRSDEPHSKVGWRVIAYRDVEPS